MSPGQIAFEAWTRQHYTHHHCDMRGWQDLSEADKTDWEAAAQAVVDAGGH
jgi:hypothetical protein